MPVPAWLALSLISLASTTMAGPPTMEDDPFRQLEEILPTPNETRVASGAPGARYWQQEANYTIKVELDESVHRLHGVERIEYTNHSPDALGYVWLQLDQNIFAPDAPGETGSTTALSDRLPYRTLKRLLAKNSYDGRVKLHSVTVDGKPAKYTVVHTMMRIDLPGPLAADAKVDLGVEWSYIINDAKEFSGRAGRELFEADNNHIYEMAQWFPRMAAYNDVSGWQHKQYMGRGEFTLDFGDYDVEIIVPSDHVVASTGVLQNPAQVLNATARKRLEQAKKSRTPVFVVTPDEAKEAEKNKAKGTKSWHFVAKNVRDFAWASSRKFIWDAKVHKVGKNEVWAMSYYPNEAEPLWSRYSTHSIIHTLDVYSRYTFDYPYPVAISVNGPIGGMEYPMISFNGPRPEKDGTYSARTKYGLISVIIHEVGHNYFPMIVNSDERQWTWMDEGLNTFVQFLAEQEWEADYPSRRGEPRDIVEYMRNPDQVPIMTNSESLWEFGNNAYGKPATALNILRETIMGRELFDFAFRTYAQRWMFRRPMPSDFFRTMEDASGIDLDWFWRGWFYTTDPVDLGIANVREFRVDSRNPDVEKVEQRREAGKMPRSLTEQRNSAIKRRVYQFEELKDFYNSYDPLDVTVSDRVDYQRYIQTLSEEERRLLNVNTRFYVVDFENIGGLVMPVILRIEYADGTSEIQRYPAEIWRMDPKRASKLITADKEAVSFTLDPNLETADIDLENNSFPRKIVKSRFQLFKEDRRSKNPMQQEREAATPGNEPRGRQDASGDDE
jgi:hypothetical protein